jgi:hypothetical protein
MPLIKAYNIDSDLHGLKSHSIFKSVYTVEASWKGTFGHLMQTASAESRFSLEDLRRRSIDPTKISFLISTKFRCYSLILLLSFPFFSSSKNGDIFGFIYQ